MIISIYLSICLFIYLSILIYFQYIFFIYYSSSLITPYFRKVDIVNSINNSVNDSTAMIIDNEDIKLDPDNIKKNLLQPGSDDKMILLG